MSTKEVLPTLGVFDEEEVPEGWDGDAPAQARKPSRLQQSLSELDETVDALGKTISDLRGYLQHVTFSEPHAEKRASTEAQSKPSSDTVRLVYELRAKVANHTERIRQLQRELEV